MGCGLWGSVSSSVEGTAHVLYVAVVRSQCVPGTQRAVLNECRLPSHTFTEGETKAQAC